jgi:hypothetical protein
MKNSKINQFLANKSDIQALSDVIESFKVRLWIKNVEKV